MIANRHRFWEILLIEKVASGLKGKTARDIWNNGQSKKIGRAHWKRAKALLQIMNTTSSLNDLEDRARPPSPSIHNLKWDRKGELALDIDILSGWRITLKFDNGVFRDVGIEDYHDK